MHRKIVFPCLIRFKWSEVKSALLLTSIKARIYYTLFARDRTVLPATKHSLTCLHFPAIQPHSITAIWKVIVPTQRRMARLSWPRWLQQELNSDIGNHPDIKRVWRKASSYRRTLQKEQAWLLVLLTVSDRNLLRLFAVSMWIPLCELAT